MRNDKTTLKDLSIFAQQDGDVFSLINHTSTDAGREVLRRFVQEPPDNMERLKAQQEVTRWWLTNPGKWTEAITNGTLVMLEKFFESADAADTPPTGLSLVLGSFFQRLLNRNQYTFIQFSVSHLTDFLKGCTEIISWLDDAPPEILKNELSLMKAELEHPLVKSLANLTSNTPFPELSRLSFRARRELKGTARRLLAHYAKLDCWHALALAVAANNWSMPELFPSSPIRLDIKGFYHPLLQSPVSYDICFDEGNHFLFLTGANMSGKTTFMRALGVTALLAHLGTGVPAKSAQFSFLKGIITNMHVEDNILRGESYFFAEVQRMKQTAQRMSRDEPYLVLMDELFKGTNVYDAYECTKAVVGALLNRKEHLMILSTHLHEVAHHFEDRKEIQFDHFVTELSEDGSYRFTYELKKGISNDRIGYRILKEQGVISLLEEKIE